MSGHKSKKKGSNIICRVSNATPEMVCKYVSRLPKQKMSEEAFRKYMGDGWFQNEHQAPEQWGLYYIDGVNYYPRFNREISIEDAEQYLYGWIKRLIVINPYTRFKTINDNRLVESIVSHMENNPNEHDLKEIIRKIINTDEPFVVNEIIANAINSYSEVLSVKQIDKDNEKFDVSLLPNYKEIIKRKYNMNKKEYFDLFSDIKLTSHQDDPKQQIFYGAPGTGKSHEITLLTDGDVVIRTTFHPDSDYSTFVGAYKPTMKENVISKNGVETKEEQIVYRFVPQAFTKAYTAAWNTTEVVFLIIEEINRGNCAQIFGDLFQLLDRKDGVSEYPVDADSDFADHIRKELTFSPRTDFPEGVKEGKKLVLPSNLFIWATMNTSDQSLFPIDSAFKRRWDWRYIPIAQGKNEDGTEKKWEIEGQGENSWWTFIQGINEVIDVTTHSEDKKLGFFFCKAQDGVVKKETFVNKVVFYLWNDVFKVYGFKSVIFDMKGKDDKTEKITFKSFYNEDGSVNEETMSVFVKNVMAKAPKGSTDSDNLDVNEEQSGDDETQA